MKHFLTVLSRGRSHSTQVEGSNQLSPINGKLPRRVKWLCIVVPMGIVISLVIFVVAWRDSTITPVALAAPPPISATASRVTVGSPSGQTPENHQNEPAIAMDAHNPDVLVAGVNDFIDVQPCLQSLATLRARCEAQIDGITRGIGISGVYFSFDRGQHWTQPTYSGWSHRSCSPDADCPGEVGPIGTLPWYYEAGLISLGDPAVAIGPRPVNGMFSWENGSRVYYANMTVDFPGRNTLRGYTAIAVSRLDNPTAENVQQKSSWMPPVIVSRRQLTPAYEDKDQIWVDNAASSPFFGRVYTCDTQYRSNGNHGPLGTYPDPIRLGVSSDGGDSWRLKQVTPADAAQHGISEWGFGGCTIRTNSRGEVFLFATMYDSDVDGLPTHNAQVLAKSKDGGVSWTKLQIVGRSTDPCFFYDPLSGSCVMDGYAGARNGISSAPSIDIANGAPTGLDATDMIVNSWVDANDGLNHEKARVSWSSDGGTSWQGPTPISLPGDRPIFTATAISPAGDRVYVVYEAVASPWRGFDLTSPRPYHGVLLTAPINPAGPDAWTTVYNGPFGDLRGTYPGHRLREERIGDYVYAAASREYGVGIWTDARDAGVCPSIQNWRADSLAAGIPLIPAPWPLISCPDTFGNTDIWTATTH